MTEQEKAISQLCVEMQGYCDRLREDYDTLYDSYYMDCLDYCIERIRRRVDPDFNELCEAVEETKEVTK